MMYRKTAERLIGKYYGLTPHSLETIDWRQIPGEGLSAESFRLVNDRGLILEFTDEKGWLYGILEYAFRLSSGLPLSFSPSRAPAPFRAVKFDLPWSAYRPGKALADHYTTCRDRDYWVEFLDMMVLNRFNVLSLWNLHPFPFMIRCTKYPEACSFNEKTLAEWQDFWRFLFREARERGIDTYMVFWNIFASYGFQEAHGLARYEGQYHFGPGYTSDLVADYNRESVRQLIDEYPDLTGLGISLGERMQGMSVEEQSNWIEKVVFQGIRDAERPIKFIYRAPFAQNPEPVRKSMESASFLKEIFVEYKFNWSHGHSSTDLCSTHDTRQDRAGVQKINDFFWNPPSDRYKICWTVRNEDFFTLRWGNAAFIRDHIKKNSPEWSAGYFIGSEGMIPALDIYRREDDAERDWQWIFQRQWLFWHLWGRLLYNADRSDGELAAPMVTRFGKKAGPLMYQAWQTASEMVLYLARFYGSTWDYTLFAECFLSPCGPRYSVTTTTNASPDNRALISLKDLMTIKTMDPAFLSFSEWQGIPDNKSDRAQGITPIQLADTLRHNADTLEGITGDLDEIVTEENPAPPYASELRDIRIWKELTAYFACKLEAGAALTENNRAEAVEILKEGIEHWDNIITLAEGRTQPVVYARHSEDVFIADWKTYRQQVVDDLDFAENF